MKLHLGRREPAAVSGKLRCAAYYLVLFLCVFLPVRSPIADVTTAVVKAVPDVLIVLLLLWLCTVSLLGSTSAPSIYASF